jgi:hypothetical protein
MPLAKSLMIYTISLSTINRAGNKYKYWGFCESVEHYSSRALFITMPSSSAIPPNPDVYLNHLSPQEAIEYEATRNILIILLGVRFPVPYTIISFAQPFKRLPFGTHLPLSLMI